MHEGRAGRGTGQPLAVGPLKDHRAGRELVDIGGFADLVPVAPKDAGLEIIGDQEEDVLYLGNGVSGGRQEEKKEDDEELPERLKGCDKELVKRIEQEVIDSGSPVTFEDVAGLADAKRSIQEMVIWPMQRPELFTGLRAVPKGLLLFGPPGTGKTLIGRANASSSGATPKRAAAA